MNANIPNTVRKAVYKRDRYRCALCDSTDGLQVHHVIPRGQGGSNNIQNLITLCWRDHWACHKQPDRDDVITPEEAQQACVEYVADYYADRPNGWNPWEKLPWEWEG